LNPKTARKLQAHQGSCVIVGRLAWQDNQLQLLEAGATLIPQQPAEPASQPGATSAPTG